MKRIFILILLGSVCNIAAAQFNVSFLKSSNQQLIEDVVGKGLMVVRQEYQLEDTVTTKRYTLDGKPEFGSAVSFAVKTDAGYIVSREVATPWANDDNYKKYEGTKYRPVLTRTVIRSVKDLAWSEIDCLNSTDVTVLHDSVWVETVSSASDCGGFKPDTLYGEKDGWFVWLTSKGKDINTDALSLVAYKTKLSFDKQTEVMSVAAANTDNHLIGGVYLVPDFSGIGQMSLLLTGIIVKDGSEWKLVMTGKTVSDKGKNEDTLSEGVLTELTEALTSVSEGDTESVELIETVSDAESEKDLEPEKDVESEKDSESSGKVEKVSRLKKKKK